MTDKEAKEILEKLRKMSKEEVCPNCGRCPLCGRSRDYIPYPQPIPTWPFEPQPYYPNPWPLYYSPVTCTSDTTIANNSMQYTNRLT